MEIIRYYCPKCGKRLPRAKDSPGVTNPPSHIHNGYFYGPYAKWRVRAV